MKSNLGAYSEPHYNDQKAKQSNNNRTIRVTYTQTRTVMFTAAVESDKSATKRKKKTARKMKHINSGLSFDDMLCYDDVSFNKYVTTPNLPDCVERYAEFQIIRYDTSCKSARCVLNKSSCTDNGLFIQSTGASPFDYYGV